MGTTPIIAPDGSGWDIPAAKVGDAIRAGGKMASSVLAPDGTKWLIPQERVRDALGKGGQLIGTSPQPPSVEMKEEPGSDAPERFMAGAKAGMGGENALNTAIDPNHPIATNPMIPGAGVYRDIKSGNYAGAAGRVLGPAAALAPMLAGGLGRTTESVNSLKSLRQYPGAPAPVAPQPAPFPEAPTPELQQSGGLAAGGRPTPPPQSAALGRIPAKNSLASLNEQPVTRKAVSSAVDKALNVEPLKQDVPLREQVKPQGDLVYHGSGPGSSLEIEKTGHITAGDFTSDINQARRYAAGWNPDNPGDVYAVKKSDVPGMRVPEGGKIKAVYRVEPNGKLTPLETKAQPISQAKAESSAINDYRYDPEAQEMHITSKNGQTYVYGDVSPDQAQAFHDAPSKGKAWAEFKQSSSPLVAKIVNGKRVPVKPVITEDLTPQLLESLKQAKARRSPAQ